MNINELSIDNYVLYKKEPHKIRNIYGEGRKSLTLESFDSKSFILRSIITTVRDIEPIPITPAILEQSGWAKTDKSLYYFLYKDAELGVQALDMMDMDNHWFLSVNDLFVIEIKYLHQLQNLLTICGIEIPLTI